MGTITSESRRHQRAAATGRGWTSTDIPDQTGRTVLVTGANSGLVAFYAQSKLANVLFALELDRRLKAAGVPVKSVLAHPGYAATNLQLSGPSGILKLFLRFGNRFLAQPAEMGVLPQLYASTAPDVEGGVFIGPNGKNEKKGYPTWVQPVKAARDTTLARRLWQLSEDLTGTRPAFSNMKRAVA